MDFRYSSRQTTNTQSVKSLLKLKLFDQDYFDLYFICAERMQSASTSLVQGTTNIIFRLNYVSYQQRNQTQ